ncbi:aminotransferase class I/II-fold pyridoxal phosphate-dependent enzyme [Flaviaesturariibacter flavus]|uniref:Aminotransferase n=1 Tax=Flaviaesturariibacter flavus TaxID=2502780 RepID=A0A4V2NWH9_9BACT|nr:aminotransferase class I/II-fold pyridoxal phosphate-dependent enzyme [Flaviaesturariibacter flavus]TCJ17422.1 aminotransferase class I/II-fold pyridoxal phosphate-dependent enzyme [Flaviaesturariibacter flavus]
MRPIKMIQTAKRLSGIGEYYFSQKLREIDALNAGGADVINLGIGSPDGAPHASVIAALQDAAARPDVHAYQSYKGAAALRGALAAWYGRCYGVPLDPATEILPLIGSKEGILHLCMTYLDPGDEALVPNPGYPTYRSAVTLAGARAVDYPLRAENGWEPDFEALEASDLSRVKLMWVNYPHMPTGTLPSRGLFEKLIAFGRKHHILICHDNPYSFILNDHPQSILAVPGAREVAVELNSLSKSHNMAGWRIGVLCGAKERIDDVLRFKSNMDSGMLLPVQLAAVAALDLDSSWQESLNATYRARRALVYAILDALGCTYDPAQAGLFVWAAVPDRWADGFALSDALLQEARVFLTPGGIFGTEGQGYIRVSLCASEARLRAAADRVHSFIQKQPA